LIDGVAVVLGSNDARTDGAKRIAAAFAAAGGAAAAADAVERRLLALLEKDGVRPICAVGQPFDPQRHLAVAVVSRTDAPNGTVVGEELRGYAVGDRVIRAAEVVVARREHGDA